MSELQSYYDNYARNPSRWSDPDPDKCGCHGRGWFLSEVDTWHRCPEHGNGVLHPDAEDYGWEADAFGDDDPGNVQGACGAHGDRDCSDCDDDDDDIPF